MHTTVVTVTLFMVFSLIQAYLDNGTREFRSIEDIDDSPALRIVRGNNAKPGEVPYQISFKKKLNWRQYYTFCGGTLINYNTIISAAHCFVKNKKCDFCSKGKVSKSDLKHYWAIAGTFKTRDRKMGSGQWKKLVRVAYPKSYKFPKDDIAIVKLSSRVRYNYDVQPVKYAKGPLNLDGKTCRASGFGRLSITGKARDPTYLQVAYLKILTKKECNKWHGKNMDKFICTSHVKSDVAEGDSGGPLVCTNVGTKGNESVLVGVVCGRTTKSGNKHSSYFTRVTSFDRFLRTDGRGPGPLTHDDPGLLVWLCLCISYCFV